MPMQRAAAQHADDQLRRRLSPGAGVPPAVIDYRMDLTINVKYKDYLGEQLATEHSINEYGSRI